MTQINDVRRRDGSIDTTMGKIAIFLYGLAAYVVFFFTFLYAIGFVTGLAVPKTIDTGTVVPMTEALIVSAVRTPVGRAGGALADVRADDLAAIAIRGCLDRAGFDPRAIAQPHALQRC